MANQYNPMADQPTQTDQSPKSTSTPEHIGIAYPLSEFVFPLHCCFIRSSLSNTIPAEDENSFPLNTPVDFKSTAWSLRPPAPETELLCSCREKKFIGEFLSTSISLFTSEAFDEAALILEIHTFLNSCFAM
jgi:hypothetical protein